MVVQLRVRRGVLAHQAPDGKHRLGRSAAAASAAVSAVSHATAATVARIAAAGIGSSAQVHDYGGAMVPGLGRDHLDAAGGDDGIYRASAVIACRRDRTLRVYCFVFFFSLFFPTRKTDEKTE